MIEETFTAPTPRDAFELARDKYGVFSDLQLLRATQTRDEEGRLRANIVVAVPQEDYMASIGIDEEEELIGEIGQLREQMDRMRSAIDPDHAPHAAISEVKDIMLKKGINDQWLTTMMRPIENDSMADDKSLLLSYILEGMDEQIKIHPEGKDSKRRLMLIGPTGVGKTTTIAKIAARYALDKESPKTVAIVNLDSYRVGAFEQMKHYADALGVEHYRVDSVDGFRDTLTSLEEMDVVLIDTAGISPYDIERLVKTIELIKSLPENKVETALVISATAKYDDIVAIYDHFSFMDIDSAILTKFDETRRIGEALGFVLDKNLPISYISTGQEVPDDIEVADREQIMIRFVEELHV